MNLTLAQANLSIEQIRQKPTDLSLQQNGYFRLLRKFLPGNVPSHPERQAPELVLLPEEGALPGVYSFQNNHLHTLQPWCQLLGKHRAWLSGGLSQDNVSHQYNTVFFVPALSNCQPELYHKHYLVLFGETFPALPDPYQTQLEQWLHLDFSSFSQGAWQQKPFLWLTNRPGGTNAQPIKIGPLLCFELLKLPRTRYWASQDVDLLVNLSNLGWFQQDINGNPQMEAQFSAWAQLVASWSHRPVVVVANQGPSLVVNARGRVITQLIPHQAQIKTMALTTDLMGR
jgi:apolipoprotein N-acyltransferase